jgi:hypothetical protein
MKSHHAIKVWLFKNKIKKEQNMRNNAYEISLGVALIKISKIRL